MTVSSKWKVMFNCFDPLQPLSGSQLDAWFVEREYSPLPRLELSLRPDYVEQKTLLVGQRGCGKTSELFKLISKMQGTYFTVYVDLFASLDVEMTSRIELLFCLGAAVYKSARQAGLKLDERLWKELVSSLSTLIREQTRQSSFELDPVGVLAAILATAGMKYPLLAVGASVAQGIGSSARLSFPVGRRDIERLELEPVLREVIARVNALIAEVTRISGKPVLLVADGLDKIALEEHAQLIFGRSWVLTAIQCQAVYTVPVVLYYSPEFREVRNYFSSVELPNVRLHAKGKRDVLDKAGMNLMWALVEKRIQGAGLEVPHVFEREALKYLIEMSGGLMRDMIRAVREAVLEAELAQSDLVTLSIARQAINRMRREWEAGMFEEHYVALLDIEQSGGRINESDPAQMDLLRNRYVVNYENGGFWRDVHPIALVILADYKLELARASREDMRGGK